MGPTAEDCIIAMFAYLYKTRTISSLVYCFRSCGASFMFYGYVGVRGTSLFQTFVLSGCYVCGVLVNGL